MRADPFFALGRLLELPERSLGLEPIDQEFARLERRLAVRRADRHQHDPLARLHPPVAMHDQRRLERPAALGLGLDLLQRLLGHAWIVLERQRIDLVAMIALAHMHLSHQPDEHRQSADPLVSGAQPVELGADIEICLLDTHRHGVTRR